MFSIVLGLVMSIIMTENWHNMSLRKKKRFSGGTSSTDFEDDMLDILNAVGFCYSDNYEGELSGGENMICRHQFATVAL